MLRDLRRGVGMFKFLDRLVLIEIRLASYCIPLDFAIPLSILHNFIYYTNLTANPLLEGFLGSAEKDEKVHP
jgi:hypothetical protein